MHKRKHFLLLIISFIFACLSAVSGTFIGSAKENTVYLGGMPAGFTLYGKGAYVAGVCDVITDKGLCSPAKNSDIRVGDLILSINGTEVNSAIDIENTIKKEDKTIIIIDRKGEKVIKDVQPVKDVNGKLKLGVLIKDTINGIGTITFIKGGRFASLGHPVLDDDMQIMKIRGGEIFSCTISGVVKGERGKPGELKGIFMKTMPNGKIQKNLENGVYGNLNDNSEIIKNAKKIEIGKAKVGKATIFTTIEGVSPKEYDISIVKIDMINKGVKNFVIKIDDDEIISKTGGIVQGMSGSPIVQDGKLVGAVTHVFINDPTRGFGIDICNMINN